MGAVPPLACSVAIHLGLGALVVAAGSLGMAAHPSVRVVWLDLEPAEIPAAVPPPPPVVSRPRPVPAPVVVPRKPMPPPALDEPVTPPPPPVPPVREAVAPEPPPAPSVASAPPAPSVVASFKNPEPDQGGASPTTVSASALPSPASPSAGGAPIDAGPSGGPPERGPQGPGRATVASRPPDAAPGGPIVRAARPKGGYQVRPAYPESARRAGIQGTTLLRIHIEVDGRVSDVTIERSAGHQALDQAAADAVRRWRFEPALNSAGAVSVWALVPVEFRISDRD
jgi:protein TonB